MPLKVVVASVLQKVGIDLPSDPRPELMTVFLIEPSPPLPLPLRGKSTLSAADSSDYIKLPQLAIMQCEKFAKSRLFPVS